MVAALGRSGLEKSGAKPQPLMKFMDGTTQAKDFKVRIDDRQIYIEIDFGR